MKKKWFVMVFMMLVLTACDQDCNPNGPDMPVYVTANGVYERVYTITHPNDNQPAQVAFEMEGGGRVWNATQVSEGNYTFSAGNRLATYPNGAHYEIYFFDPKVETTDRAVSYTHLRAHETPEHLVCRLLLEKKKKKQ